ncbi:polysaccharide biosynthesis/export family protein [Pseudoruegeria sp. SK021]|uniref:polysaccharide biosynthesis/export family protein n=1 Tax=Pseudoruegeria sp. SK021 TaxID=1933035 RepID=UPI001F0B256F|nr:polysaccharide biosynthesis/export family protein [Pseudoruegeria sp. SK021]
MIGSREWHKKLAVVITILSLAGCSGAIPRPGPTKGELYETSVLKGGDAYIVSVNQGVAKAAEYTPPLGFPSSFKSASMIEADVIQPGDTLSLAIWENVQEGLLSVAGVPAPLDAIQVDGDGMIFVPYAGRISAAGKTPDNLRAELSQLLGAQTPDPQITVMRRAGDGNTVSISGKVTAQGVYPIERPTRRLSSMLSRAGGVTIEPEIAQVTVLRGRTSGKVWFNSLYADPENDIALRTGDRILVEADERYYTAMGAAGRQSRVRFESQELSAMEALAQVGGLSSVSADPTGIFLLREEPQEIARKVLGQPDLTGTQKIAYIFDLTKGEGLFVARNFTVRDEDTIFITEAPVSQFNKAISAVFGSLTTVASINTLASQ